MISASQLKAAACPRKWAFKQLSRLPYVPGPAAQFGIDGHKEIEKWLSAAEPPNQLTAPGRLAAEGIPHLPQPGTCLVEQRFDILVDGVYFLGYIDVLDSRDGVPTVYDHKFTGRPDRALTSDSLRRDEQGILYSYAASVLFDAPLVHAKWIYYPRNGQRVFAVEIEWSRSDLEVAMKPLIELGRVLQDWKAFAPLPSIWVAREIPCEPHMCNWTGSFCDFAEHCDRRNEWQRLTS